MRTYTVEYCLAIKHEILSFSTTWVDLEDIIWSGISHKQKGKHSMNLFISRI
jgi:hypothetical protein